MLHRLSALWGMPKQQIRETISAQELGEHMAYFSLEPFGYAQAAIHHAELMSLTANMAGNKSKPSDFLPDHLKPTKQKLTEDVLNKMLS